MPEQRLFDTQTDDPNAATLLVLTDIQESLRKKKKDNLIDIDFNQIKQIDVDQSNSRFEGTDKTNEIVREEQQSELTEYKLHYINVPKDIQEVIDWIHGVGPNPFEKKDDTSTGDNPDSSSTGGSSDSSSTSTSGGSTTTGGSSDGSSSGTATPSTGTGTTPSGSTNS